ncbi:hypothetical protein QTP70_030641, partial [Hemibagrus guttatus]
STWSPSLCQWISNSLTGRLQAVRMCRHIAASLTLSTGAPQGCVMSPLLYSLYTYDCVATTRNSTMQDRRALQRVVRSDECIIRTKLPDLHSIYSKRCWTKARKIMKDLSHPNNGLFSLLRRYTDNVSQPTAEDTLIDNSKLVNMYGSLPITLS